MLYTFFDALINFPSPYVRYLWIIFCRSCSYSLTHLLAVTLNSHACFTNHECQITRGLSTAQCRTHMHRLDLAQV